MTAPATRYARSGPSGADRRVGGGAGGAGLRLAVLSAATFGTSGTFGSALIRAGWSPAAAVLARVAVSALILTAPALVQLRGRWMLLRREAGRAVAFGLTAVAGCQLCYFSAIARLPVGVALLLEYLGAVLVVGWMWLRHRQRPGKLTTAGAAAAFAGLAMVLNPTGPGRISPFGVMWGLFAAVCLATYFLLSAAPVAEPLPPLVMAWAGMCVGATALAALGGVGVLRVTARASAVDFLGHRVSWVVPMAGLSLVAAVVAYVAGIGAARRLGAKLASFVGMGEVPFAILFAWLLLGQLPSVLQFLGGAFMLAGIALVRVDELREIQPPPGGPDAYLAAGEFPSSRRQAAAGPVEVPCDQMATRDAMLTPPPAPALPRPSRSAPYLGSSCSTSQAPPARVGRAWQRT